jgi:hypothetical protein
MNAPTGAAMLAAIGSPCPYCGQTMQIPDRPPSRDHIKPRSKGYSLDGNLALVCCRCNTDKGSLSLGQWLTRLSRAGDVRADHVAAFLQLYTGCQKPDQAALGCALRSSLQGAAFIREADAVLRLASAG